MNFKNFTRFSDFHTFLISAPAAADGRRRASVTSRAERSRTVAENISIQDREKVWFEMTEAMMNDLNASLDRQIRKNFAPYLR